MSTAVIVWIVILAACGSSVAIWIRRTYQDYLSSKIAEIRRVVRVRRLAPRVWEPVDPDLLYACEVRLEGCGEVARWRECAGTNSQPVYACEECRERL